MLKTLKEHGAVFNSIVPFNISGADFDGQKRMAVIS